jgi:hypothetical protein
MPPIPPNSGGFKLDRPPPALLNGDPPPPLLPPPLNGIGIDGIPLPPKPRSSPIL